MAGTSHGQRTLEGAPGYSDGSNGPITAESRLGANVSDVRMPESGMANDTVMFRLDGEALVARLAPAPGSAYPTFRTYDLGFQRRVIELVRARTKVPVPEIVHLEESESWIDAPFMVI